MSGDFIPFDKPRFLTPDDIPSGVFCRTFQVPDDPAWVGVLDGVVTTLAIADNWRQSGTLTPEETADQWQQTIVDSWAILGCAPDDLSPFWDDPDGADAEGTPAESTYSFTDRLEDWAIAAFVAASGVPGAAVTYLTIAPRFRLAFRTRDYGGIVKIIIDGVLYGEVDTYSATPGLTYFDVVTG